MLAILLYGSESWLIFAHVRDRLRVFHAQRLWTMCHITRLRQRDERISTATLEREMYIEPIDTRMQWTRRWRSHEGSHEGSHELVVMRVVVTDVEDGLQRYSSVITDTRSYTTGAPPAGSKPRWVTKYRFRI